MRQTFCASTLRLTILMFCVVAVEASQGGKKTDKARRYADGPLTVDDFAGTPPEKSPVNLRIEMVANTECEVRYEYRAAIEQRGSEAWTARITSFTCVAVIDPAKCWLAWRDSRRVLDHEQGHFDLAELASRRAELHFTNLIRDKRTLASGRDRRAAQRTLNTEITKAMDEVYESLAQAQKTYDEETRHGTSYLAQRRHRQWQRAELEKTSGEGASAARKGEP